MFEPALSIGLGAAEYAASLARCNDEGGFVEVDRFQSFTEVCKYGPIICTILLL